MLAQALSWLGFGLCHQLPERSFFGGGIQSPVCARDEGIYIGFVVALVVVWLLHRPRRPREFPGPLAMSVAVLFIGAMALDGFTSYGGFRETTNEIRLLTGTMAGFGIAAIVAPMLYGEVWRRSDAERVLSPGYRLALWVLAVPAAFVAVRWGAPYIGAAYPVLVALSILTTLTTVNLVIAALLPPFERRAELLKDLTAPLAVAIGLTVVEIALAGLFKVVLLRLVS